MFGGQQQLVAVAAGVGSEQQARASGLEQGRGGSRRVEGVDRRLAQGAGQQDGAIGLAGKIDESRQAAGETRDGTGGIEDEQAEVQAADDGGQVGGGLGGSVRAGVGQS